MQGTTRGMQGSGCKVLAECRGIPGERTRVEAKYQGNAAECRGMQGNAGKRQGNVWEWV